MAIPPAAASNAANAVFDGDSSGIASLAAVGGGAVGGSGGLIPIGEGRTGRGLRSVRLSDLAPESVTLCLPEG